MSEHSLTKKPDYTIVGLTQGLFITFDENLTSEDLKKMVPDSKEVLVAIDPEAIGTDPLIKMGVAYSIVLIDGTLFVTR